MNRFEVGFRPSAEADLFGLYRYIAEKAGHEIASAYIDRIETACMALETFPERGASRNDIHPGLRTMGFEWRATIVFLMESAEAVIGRIFSGGQDQEPRWPNPLRTRRPHAAVRVARRRSLR